jgi:hypothetical protein
MKIPATFVIVAVLLGACVYSCSRPVVYDWTLPHRPMAEIDIQGHQPYVVPNGDQCPGQYTYGAYGVTITCWGTK